MAQMAGLRWHDWLLCVGQNGCFYSSANIKYKFVWEKGGWAKWGVAQQPSASSSCEWTPTEPGEYTVYLDVIDGSAERHLTRKVTVGERCSVESLEVSGSALCGKPVKLQAKVSGDASGLKC